MSEMEQTLIKTLKELESELERQKKAIKHIREALRILKGRSSEATQECLSGGEDSKESIAQVIDSFIDTIKPGEGFMVNDVVRFVVEGGYPESDALRTTISSTLRRRVKQGVLSRVGSRGSFEKPGYIPSPTEEKKQSDHREH